MLAKMSPPKKFHVKKPCYRPIVLANLKRYIILQEIASHQFHHTTSIGSLHVISSQTHKSPTFLLSLKTLHISPSDHDTQSLNHTNRPVRPEPPTQRSSPE